MSLSKNEISSFLGILIKKNPIVDVSIEYDKIKFTHFNNKIVEIPLDNEIDVHSFSVIEKENLDSEYYEYQNSIQEDSYQDYVEEVKKKSEEYMKTLNETVQISETKTEQLITEYFSEFHLSNQLVIEEINSSIVAQINQSLESIKNITPVETTIHTTETIKEEYDDTSIRLWAKKEFDSLKELVESVINEKPSVELITETVEYDDAEIKDRLKALEEVEKIQTIHTTETIKEEYNDTAIKESINKIEESLSKPVDYSSVYQIIDNKISAIHEELATKMTNDVFISSIETLRNRIVVKKSNGSFSDITDLLLPIIKIQIASVISAYSGTGSDGYSAYEIATRNGFIGSEADWLASLSGGFVAPEPGTIIYDVDGKIERIEKPSGNIILNRDISGVIVSVQKPTYIQEFIRDVNGRITGWTII